MMNCQKFRYGFQIGFMIVEKTGIFKTHSMRSNPKRTLGACSIKRRYPIILSGGSNPIKTLEPSRGGMGIKLKKDNPRFITMDI
jgi:hypothetical protein